MILYWILWFDLKSNRGYRMTAKELTAHLKKLGVEYVVTTRPNEDSPNLIGIRFWVEKEEKDLTLS